MMCVFKSMVSMVHILAPNSLPVNPCNHKSISVCVLYL